MSAHDTTYDPSNVFARILRGELPCHKVHEDAGSLAFMDIMPRGTGHTLVIPKTPARNMLDATPEQLAAVMATVRRVAKAQMAAFGAHGILVQQFSEPAAGQEVYHIHFHVIPRFDGVKLGPPATSMEKGEILAANAAKLREAMAAIS
jgi:histidine triad (HIT) family protein